MMQDSDIQNVSTNRLPMKENRVMENWPTVSSAIRLRIQQLGISQAGLIIRSGLSKAIVGELIRGNTVRHRSPRTLAAMSEALDWHPDHLESLLRGKIPPKSGEPRDNPSPAVNPWEEIAARLASIEQRLVEIDHKINLNTPRNEETVPES